MPLHRLKSSGAATISEHVATAPPAGGLPVTNIYWDPGANKMTVEYDDEGYAAGNILSTPPVGMYAVTNLFFDPSTGRLSGEYDDGA